MVGFLAASISSLERVASWFDADTGGYFESGIKSSFGSSKKTLSSWRKQKQEIQSRLTLKFQTQITGNVYDDVTAINFVAQRYMMMSSNILLCMNHSKIAKPMT